MSSNKPLNKMLSVCLSLSSHVTRGPARDFGKFHHSTAPHAQQNMWDWEQHQFSTLASFPGASYLWLEFQISMPVGPELHTYLQAIPYLPIHPKSQTSGGSERVAYSLSLGVRRIESSHLMKPRDAAQKPQMTPNSVADPS